MDHFMLGYYLMKQYKPQTISIIGFGRFGQLLATMLSKHFTVQLYDKKEVDTNTAKGCMVVDLKTACQADAVFFAVPISQLESVVKKAAQYVKSEAVVFDVASVKVHSKKIFQKYLPKDVYAILTHPMFGPDSARDSVEHLPIVMHNLSAAKLVFAYWQKFFLSLGLNVVTMSPEEHDKNAAYSQGVTHFMGRVLDDMKLAPTPIDTKGFEALLEVRAQTCNDTWQLFEDLQVYNPYTKDMRHKLEKSIKAVSGRLIPKKHTKTLVIGIQGGKGSFNEEACIDHCKHGGITDYKIEYLYTSERVLKALHDGHIDYGQCAIQNGIGGMVRETIKAMARYQCEIAYEFEFIVNHCLMVRPGVSKKDIRIIMSHPQALAQCKTTLAKRYPKQHKKSETGKLIDQSLLAKHLGAGKLTRSIAVLAPSICADLYGLKIVDEGLQDLDENFTTFLWLK